MMINWALTFHEKFDLPIANEICIPVDSHYMRVRLLQEELNELIEAFEQGDLVEVLDALCDIEFVLHGTILECGMQNIFQLAMEEVERSNLSKLEDGKPLLREDGKVLKGKNFFKPRLKPFIDGTY